MHRDWKTVRKYVDMDDFNVRPSKRKRRTRKLEPYMRLIDSWLEGDKKRPRKQRHTARRVFKRLVKECPGFDCCYRSVAQYVREHRKCNHDKGHLPLIHEPGSAQFDFGDAIFMLNGKKVNGHYAVLTFPHSNAGLMQLCLGLNQECLCEALKNMFEFLGGVPASIWFDNASAIVTMRDGKRHVHEAFRRFALHYGFEPVFMNPAAGHEKGNVENKVGYFRKNYFVPIPDYTSLEDANKQLLNVCLQDMERLHYHRDKTIAQLFADDKKQLRPLPSTPFEVASYLVVVTNHCGKFDLDGGRHTYSTAPSMANSTIKVQLTATNINILGHDDCVIISHPRLYGQSKCESIDWAPYLGYIARHPRSVKNTGIFNMMPDSMKSYIVSCSISERKDLLHELEALTERSTLEAVLKVIDEAMKYQAYNRDSLRSVFNRMNSGLPVVNPLRGDAAGVQLPAYRDNTLEFVDAVVKKEG